MSDAGESEETGAADKCCASCGKAEGDDIQLKTCTACKSVRYCGVNCQRNHRPKHKKECKKRAAELRDQKTGAVDKSCACCGIAELDDTKLKPCDDCDLIRYCSDACREDHRPEHEAKCKERAAELRDEVLFRQPECYLGDCPICLLPFPLDPGKYMFHECCSKVICGGCQVANMKCQGLEQIMGATCPFCRNLTFRTEEEANKRRIKRIEANDPIAIREMGVRHIQEKNYVAAMECYRRAAELGDVDAYHKIGMTYLEGGGIEKDEKKALFHLEKAAIAGHPDARFMLGYIESQNGRDDRAVKHWIIAATHGCDESISLLKEYYKSGDISKEVFAAALRSHHAAANAMKSPQREAASKAINSGEEM